jgi:hypothetical protein
VRVFCSENRIRELHSHVLDELKKMPDNLDPNDTIITKLENEGKLRIVPSKWYI